MSLATWKAEFYPIPASRVSKKNALAHSLRKWQGLTKAALKRHGLIRDDYGIFGEDRGFYVDSDTCALCHFWISDVGCIACPLAIVRSGVRCDSEMAGEKLAPWEAFAETGDARPMISWLKRAIKAQGSKP